MPVPRALQIRSFIALAAIFSGIVTPASAQDQDWPRLFRKDGAEFVVYQPQVDDWINFSGLHFRFAFSITPPAGKQFVGVAVLDGGTAIDPENDLITVTPLTICSITFPSLNAGDTAELDQLVRSFIPASVKVSLRRLVASTPKKGIPTGVAVRNDPPAIFVSNRPAILLYVDGLPRYAPVPGTQLDYLVNTTWPVFLDRKHSEYYMLVDKQWMTASVLEGPWTPAKKLHREMDKLPQDPQWASLRSVIPPPPPNGLPVPSVLFSTIPGEVILFDGAPNFVPIPGTQLAYAVNTASNVFFYGPSRQYFFLTAGRWFSADSLQGPWTYATAVLPADFMEIPPAGPAGRVLSSVPGTEEAKDAVVLARAPTTVLVNPQEAASHVIVAYYGEPLFAPIEGTSLFYALNTQDKVIQVDNTYYLCLQGVWFTSVAPQGPWTTATVVPPVIYTIPPGSPVYNVTYVTQTMTPAGNVQASYTAGYLGGFIVGTAVGAIVFSGTGYYYPPYFGPVVYGGYSAYIPYAGTYGVYSATAYTTAHGAYGMSHSVSGAYGSATSFSQYNPYTGTYTRGASVSTPYGSRSAVQAYNPYTGTYAAHASGSSPTAQWGSSVVSGPGGTAIAQHVTTAQGNAGAVQTSAGGRAAGVATAQGQTFEAGKSATGDLYAGHDGNVYRNTASGWQQYQNGSWNNISHPSSPRALPGNSSLSGSSGNSSEGGGPSTQGNGHGAPSTLAESGPPSGNSSGGSHTGGAPDGLNGEPQNRQRGAQSSQRFLLGQRGWAGRRR